MRVIVTMLMDGGKMRSTRAMPVDAHMRSHRDGEGRLIYQLYYLDKGGRDPIFGSTLIAPQCGPVEAKLIYYGFERKGGGETAPLVAQAWEVELPPRR